MKKMMQIQKGGLAVRNVTERHELFGDYLIAFA